MDTPQTTGERIRYLRTNLGLSRSDLAKASGLSETGLKKIELGLTDNPRARNLAKIADALSVTVPDLTGADLGGTEARILAAIDDLRAELARQRP